MRKEYTIILVLIIALSLSWWHHFNNDDDNNNKSCINKYKYINFDLNCDEDPSIKTDELRDLVKKSIDSNVVLKKVDRVSVFYRDLVNRQWFGVEENELFSPASLLKLPLAISYYKLHEVDDTVLGKQIKYVASGSSQGLYDMQNIRSSNRPENEKYYSVEELIKFMIQNSDNGALGVLGQSMKEDFQDKVYLDLGLSYPVSGDATEDFVSVKTYGAILRTLYNSSYLNQELSNKLLEVMSGSTYDSGITAGVPNHVLVANKFGERKVVNVLNGNGTKYELHDCGIIYDKKRGDYILCVMTKGKDYEELENVIYDISKTIYQNR